jgi:hypothetical protein
MEEFWHTRPYLTGWQQRKHIAGKLSVTGTLTVDGWRGVYRWNGKEWELWGVYRTAAAARKAQAQARSESERLLHSN